MLNDSKKAVEFLKRVYPEGPWCLTAVHPDKKGIDTQTFYPANEEACMEWILEYNGSRNIYWHVNPVIRAVTKKAERADIASVNYFHVDVDPGLTKDLKEEQESILKKFVIDKPKGVPEPTIIIFSGGGYQAFWKLRNPIMIDGDIDKAEEVKRYNQQLEIMFGGDNCHNIDRLMRLPFTYNVPDAKKKAKGRTKTLATVVQFNEALVYDVDQFIKATIVQTKQNLSTAGREALVDVTGNVRRIADLDELDEWNVPDRVKIIIAQGAHPDADEVARKASKTGRNPSRSEWLWDVCCNLVRCGVPDNTIYALITDPGWPISESVVELKSGAHRYAVKQIVDAKEEIEDPDLRRMNSEYYVVAYMGGKVRVVWEDKTDQSKDTDQVVRENKGFWNIMSLDEFMKRFEHIQKQVGSDKDGKPVYKPLGKWWRLHPKRRQVDKMVFDPSREEIPNVLNLWQGFSVPATPGEKHEQYLNHLFTNICSGNQENFDYLLNWMARAIQRPAEQGHVAVVLQGGKGAGKGTAVKWFGKLFGRHFLHLANSTHLTGTFNYHLRDACIVFADEAFFVGDKKNQSTLKTLITEDSIAVERKGVDLEVLPNYIHLIMASNDEHVVQATGDERRYFMLKVGEGKIQDTGYFGEIEAEMLSGGLSNLLYFLQTRDISKFQVRDVPKTTALHDQMDLSMSVIENWWFEKLDQGYTYEFEKVPKWHRSVWKIQLFRDYLEYSHMVTRSGYKKEAMSQKLFHGFLKHHCGAGDFDTGRNVLDIGSQTEDGFTVYHKKRVPTYELSTLHTCRKRWDEIRKKTTDWGELL